MPPTMQYLHPVTDPLTTLLKIHRAIHSPIRSLMRCWCAFRECALSLQLGICQIPVLAMTEALNLWQDYFWDRQSYFRRQFCVIGPHWGVQFFAIFGLSRGPQEIWNHYSASQATSCNHIGRFKKLHGHLIDLRMLSSSNNKNGPYHGVESRLLCGLYTVRRLQPSS